MAAGGLPTLHVTPPSGEKYETWAEGPCSSCWVSSAQAVQLGRPFLTLVHETDANWMNCPFAAVGTVPPAQVAPPSLEYSATLKLRWVTQTAPTNLAQVVPVPMAAQSAPPAAQATAGSSEKARAGWVAAYQTGGGPAAAAAAGPGL